MKQLCWLSTAILTISFGILSSASLVSADEGIEHPEDNLHKHKAAGEAHAHSSPHGGVVKTVGNYHAELILNTDVQDPGSRIELYLLESENQVPKTIVAEELKAFVQEQGNSEFKSFTLTVEPLDGESIGNASHFVGNREDLICQQRCRISFNIPIEDKRYRVIFELDPLHQDD
jgi:hypothetical protein